MAKRSSRSTVGLQQTLFCRECSGPLLTPEETKDGLCNDCCGDDLFAERPAVPPPLEIPREKPSISKRRYWLEITRPPGDQPVENARAGKWLIFVDVWNVDLLWQKICEATVAGRLGTRSKVATAKANQSTSRKKPRVICVYTFDSDNVEDVMRVREALRELGVIQKIPYKLEEMKGRGTATGEIGVSRYFC